MSVLDDACGMSVIDLLDAEIAELEKQIERRRAARALLLDEALPAAPTPKPSEPKAAKVPGAKPFSPRRAAKPPTADGMKHCGSCDQSKPVAEFNRRTNAGDGLQSQCRPCQRAAVARSEAKTAAKNATAGSEALASAAPTAWKDPASRLALIREAAAKVRS